MKVTTYFISFTKAAPHVSSFGDASSPPEDDGNWSFVEEPVHSAPPRPATVEPRYLFGTPQNVEAKRPPANPGWDESSRAHTFECRPPILQQVPPPADPDVDGYIYPKAPIYNINMVSDPNFQRGYHYACNFSPTSANNIRKGLLSIRTPRNICPRLEDGEWVFEPVAGMTRMVPGVPYVEYIEGDFD